MSFIFSTFCLYWWGFEFAPARGRPASLSDLIITSQDYIKVEHVKTWLPNSGFARPNGFDLNAFYQVLFSLGFSVYKGNIQLMASGSWCPTGFLKGRE